jgi:hypothetical protein
MPPGGMGGRIGCICGYGRLDISGDRAGRRPGAGEALGGPWCCPCWTLV